MSELNTAPATNIPSTATTSVKPQNGKTGFDAFEEMEISDKQVKKDLGVKPQAKTFNRNVGDSMEDYADELTQKELAKKAETSKSLEVAPPKTAQPKKVEEVKKEVSQDATKSEIKKEAKRIKAMLGEEAFELPEDAEIEHKVNGEMKKFKVKDILNGFSGEVEVSKRFSEVDKQRKVLVKDQDEIRNYVKDFKEKIKSENPLDSFNFMLDQIGIDTYDYKKKLFAHFAKDYEVLSGMDPDKQKAWWTEQENEHLKAKNKSSIDKQQAEQAQQASALKAKQQREAAGISDEDYDSALDALENAKHPNITPDTIMEQAKADKAVFKSIEMLKQLDESLIAKEGLVIEIAQLYQEFPNITLQEISEILSIPTKDAQVVNQRVQDGTKTITRQVKQNNDVPLSWDDI